MGLTFCELAACFPKACVVGLAPFEGSSQRGEKNILLNPPASTIVRKGDQIVVLAEDDDSYTFVKPEHHRGSSGNGSGSGSVSADGSAEMACLATPPGLAGGTAHVDAPERVLLVGWRRDIRDLLVLLDAVVAPHSEVHILTDSVPLSKRNAALAQNGLDPRTLENMELVHWFGSPAVRRTLESLPLETYTSIVLVGDERQESDAMHSDSHSLVCLLLMRDILNDESRSNRHADDVTARLIASTPLSSRPALEKHLSKRLSLRKSMLSPGSSSQHSSATRGASLHRSGTFIDDVPIVCEVLDPRTESAIEKNATIALACDFLHSNSLTARMLAMISENRQIKHLLDELLGPFGNVIECNSASRYLVGWEHIGGGSRNQSAAVAGGGSENGEALELEAETDDERKPLSPKKVPGQSGGFGASSSKRWRRRGLQRSGGEMLSFFDIARRCQRKGETLLGYIEGGAELEATDEDAENHAWIASLEQTAIEAGDEAGRRTAAKMMLGHMDITERLVLNPPAKHELRNWDGCYFVLLRPGHSKASKAASSSPTLPSMRSPSRRTTMSRKKGIASPAFVPPAVHTDAPAAAAGGAHLPAMLDLRGVGSSSPPPRTPSPADADFVEAALGARRGTGGSAGGVRPEMYSYEERARDEEAEMLFLIDSVSRVHHGVMQSKLMLSRHASLRGR